MLTVGSTFTGVGGIDLGFEQTGRFETVWMSEVDKHASAVLAHRWPDVPNLGDIHAIGTVPRVDVIVGGFPCQDYSVAGNRGGLAGDRGALWWQLHRLIAANRPTWTVLENVPGLLSSNGGRDFRTIIESVGELGYGVVWRVLDSQWFGVAQRRRRVVIVAHSGGRPRPEVLALGQSLQGDSPPRREAGQDIAGTLSKGSPRGSFPNTDTALTGGVVAPGRWPSQRGGQEHHGSAGVPRSGSTPDAPTYFSSSGRDITGTVTTTWAKGPGNTQVEEGALVASGESQNEVRLDDPTQPLTSSPTQAVAFAENQRGEVRLSDTANLTVGGGKPGQGYPAVTVPQVRRLTPLECERLQGFPDGWTDTPGNSDTQRYRQMGNAVTVPVFWWVAENLWRAHGVD